MLSHTDHILAVTSQVYVISYGSSLLGCDSYAKYNIYLAYGSHARSDDSSMMITSYLAVTSQVYVISYGSHARMWSSHEITCYSEYGSHARSDELSMMLSHTDHILARHEPSICYLVWDHILAVTFVTARMWSHMESHPSTDEASICYLILGSDELKYHCYLIRITSWAVTSQVYVGSYGSHPRSDDLSMMITSYLARHC